MAGTSWLEVSNNFSTLNFRYGGIAISSSGKYIISSIESNYIYTSTDYGNSFTQQSAFGNWFGVSISSTGQYMCV